MIGVLSILISAGIIGLIVWLKVVAELRRQKRLPERRRKALAALAPLVNGRVDDAGLTGAWEGFPLEAANQMPQHPRDLRRWRITLGIPPGGEDWRLVDVPIVGYMFQTGDRIGSEVPMEKPAAAAIPNWPGTVPRVSARVMRPNWQRGRPWFRVSVIFDGR